MANKVTFDGVNRIIQVDEAPSGGIVEFDVKVDLYSDGKEDWKADTTLNKLKFPISAVGGNPLPGSRSLGTTFFLANDWKIRPYEGDHRFQVNGNLYSEDGTSPFTTTLGDYNVLIEQQLSSLVDSTIAQLSEIQQSTFSGDIGPGVWVDTTSTQTGTGYPSGNSEYPVNNIPDARAIALSRGLGTLYIKGNIILDTGDDVSNFIVRGENANRTMCTINPGAYCNATDFQEMMISGTLDGDSIIRNSIVVNVNYVSGVVFNSMLMPGIISLAGSGTAFFLNCYSGQPGQGTPQVDMAGDGPGLAFRGYNGGVRLTNKTGDAPVSIDLNSGQCILDSTVTNGEIVIRGVGGKLTDNSTGSANVYNELVSVPNLSRGVWNSQIADYNQAGSFGNFVQKKILTVAKFLGLK